MSTDEFEADLNIWWQYTAQKSDWLAANPGATLDQIQTALQEMIDRLGV